MSMATQDFGETNLSSPIKKNKFSASGRDRPKTVFQKKVRDFIKTQVSRTILWVKFNKLDRSPKACRKGNYRKNIFYFFDIEPHHGSGIDANFDIRLLFAKLPKRSNYAREL